MDFLDRVREFRRHLGARVHRRQLVIEDRRTATLAMKSSGRMKTVVRA